MVEMVEIQTTAPETLVPATEKPCMLCDIFMF